MTGFVKKEGLHQGKGLKNKVSYLKPFVGKSWKRGGNQSRKRSVGKAERRPIREKTKSYLLIEETGKEFHRGKK